MSFEFSFCSKKWETPQQQPNLNLFAFALILEMKIPNFKNAFQAMRIKGKNVTPLYGGR